jgi:nucleoside-diphosphate-sugar epimerase
MKNAVVFGAGGFIGHHMVKRLRKDGYWVRGVDLKYPIYEDTDANEFIVGDLTSQVFMDKALDWNFDECYQFAADMGGAGYIFTGENDANVMTNSALVNLNLLSHYKCPKKIFYSSSACMYPEHNQLDKDNPNCEESSAYPANPDSEYGWEKLFSERLFLAHAKNHGKDVKIARYHNVFGELGTWQGGKEKAPAAMCRKVAEAKDGTSIQIWGDGEQTRSFLYIEDCINATRILMDSKESGPFNIGSENMVTINQLANEVINISGKKLSIDHIDGPLGVSGRNSHNALIESKLGWKPQISLHEGLKRQYAWISQQLYK